MFIRLRMFRRFADSVDGGQIEIFEASPLKDDLAHQWPVLKKRGCKIDHKIYSCFVYSKRFFRFGLKTKSSLLLGT